MHWLLVISAVVATLANVALSQQIVGGFDHPGRCDNSKVGLITTEIETNCANGFCKKRVDGGCGCRGSISGEGYTSRQATSLKIMQITHRCS